MQAPAPQADEDTRNAFQMRPAGCGDVLRKRVCCILNIPVGFPQFQDKPILHVALRTSGARTASNPKPHRSSRAAPGVPGPCSQAGSTEGPRASEPETCCLTEEGLSPQARRLK